MKITGIAGNATSTEVIDGTPGDDAAPDTAALTARDLVTVTLNIGKLPDPNAGGAADIDGSEKLFRVVIENVPDGVSIEGAEYHGDGTWLLIYDGLDAEPIVGADGLALSVVFDVSEAAGGLSNHPISIQVQTRDGSDTSVATDTVAWHLSTDFEGGPSAIPATVEWAYNGEHATEDTEFALSDVMTAHVTVNDASVTNTFTVSVWDLPEGVQIEGMTRTSVNNGAKEIWTAVVHVGKDEDANALLQELLDGIKITPPANSNENNSAGSFNFQTALTASVPNGNNQQVTQPVTVPVDPVTDPGVISISAPSINEGEESIAVTITVSNDADGEFGQIIDGKLYVRVDQAASTNGLGNGTLTYNGSTLTTEEVDGQTYYVLTGVEAGEAINLVYTPATSTAGQVSFTALVKTQEAGSAAVITEIVEGTAEVEMINNGVEVMSTPVSGAESTAIQLTGLAIDLKDADGSESVKTVLLSGVPNGFLVRIGDSEATAKLASNAGDETWIISNPNGSLPAYVAIVPPEHWSGTLDNLKIKVESSENSFSDSLIEEFGLGAVTVNPVADGIELTATNTFGPENQIIALNLNASMADPGDASVAGAADAHQELVTLKLTGLGAFASFYIGSTEHVEGISYDTGADTYTLTGLTQSDLDQLGFLQARNALEDQNGTTAGVQIKVEAFTTDGTDSSESSTAEMTVNAYAQAPTSGNDTLLWTGSTIDAGGGTDSILLRAGENLSGSILDDMLSNVEVLQMHGNAITNLTAEDVLGITDSNNLLTVLGDAEDALTLGSEWTSAGTHVDGDTSYAIYTATVGGAEVELRIESGIID